MTTGVFPERFSGGRPLRARPSRRSGAFGAGVALLSALGAVTILVLTGNPGYSVLPLFWSAVCYAVWKLPMRATILVFSCLLVLSDVAQVDPYTLNTLWLSPVSIPFAFLQLNLNQVVPISFLRFSGTELLILVFCTVAFVRFVAGHEVDRRGSTAGAPPLYIALGVSLTTLFLLEVVGLARGGDFRQSLWQFRQLLWLPIFALLVSFSVRHARDLMRVGLGLTFVALIKVGIGLQYYFMFKNANGRVPESATSHSDTMLYVVVVAMWCAVVTWRPTLPRVLSSILIVAWIMVGVWSNSRRTAYVSLAVVLLFLIAMMPIRGRRLFQRVGLFLLPFALVYVLIGFRVTTGFFAPAAEVASLFKQDDTSSKTRDIENYNLIVTLKQHMITGSGWGHEYIEVSKAYDISFIFEQYRYIAHNGILWMLGIAGPFGFTPLLLFVPLGIFFARRSHYFARNADERIVAYVAIAVFSAYLLQAWADMGQQSWTGVVLVSYALSASGKLATATGAWPRELRVLGRRRTIRARARIAESA